MVVSGRDRLRCVAGAEVDGGEGVAHLAGLVAAGRWCRRGRAGRRWPQHLTVPSSRSAQVWSSPAADRGGGAAGAEVDGGQVVAHLAGRRRRGRWCRRGRAGRRRCCPST